MRRGHLGGHDIVQRIDHVRIGGVILGALLVMLEEARALEGRRFSGKPLGV
jgi:hypothetical protein